MDLSTTYLGIDLPHPLMPGASPMVDDLDTVRRLEDAGAAAIVMHSLFEEQLISEQLAVHRFLDAPAESFSEALSYLPSPDDYSLGAEAYLEQLHKVKAAVSVPVIASLNGSTDGGWLEISEQIAQAGADALELNVYRLVTDPAEDGAAVERRVLDMVAGVRARIGVPLAVKLSPFNSALGHFAGQLEKAGADGLVLFNRFYQADIDIEALELERRLHLSDPSELLLRLRWLAILHGQVACSLSVSGGVHTAEDAIKAIMSGAHAVQMVSALLRHGPERLAAVKDGLARWLEEHAYDSLAQMHGSMSLTRCPDPHAYERANYIQILHSWRAGDAGW